MIALTAEDREDRGEGVKLEEFIAEEITRNYEMIGWHAGIRIRCGMLPRWCEQVMIEMHRTALIVY